MRVVAGTFKGRKLKSLAGDNTRPTTDKVKEAIFNMIGPYFSDGLALDLYGGSGGLGIEAVSRGLDQAVICDQNFGAIQVIKENVAMTKVPEKFLVWKTTDEKALVKAATEELKFALVFLDPPYAKQKIAEIIENMLGKNLLSEEAFVVCETDSKTQLPEEFPKMIKIKEQNYGATKVTIYRKEV